MLKKKVAGKSQAKQIRTILFKMASKIGIMVQEGMVSDEDFQPVTGPLFDVCLMTLYLYVILTFSPFYMCVYVFFFVYLLQSFYVLFCR